MSYTTLILFRPTSPSSESVLQQVGRQACEAGALVDYKNDSMVLSWDGWAVRCTQQAGQDVAVESSDIMCKYGQEIDDFQAFASSDQRITVETDDDISMTHFRNYLFVVENLIRFSQGIAFECHTESFI